MFNKIRFLETLQNHIFKKYFKIFRFNIKNILSAKISPTFHIKRLKVHKSKLRVLSVPGISNVHTPHTFSCPKYYIILFCLCTGTQHTASVIKIYFLCSLL